MPQEPRRAKATADRFRGRPVRVRREGRRQGGGSRAFSLVELLVTLAVLSVLAALLLPALGRAKAQARRVDCLNRLRQMGLAWMIHLDDHENRFPDRRDLKTGLPGGWKPWTDWPRSDPRSGWAAVVLSNQLPPGPLWLCPAWFRSPQRRHPASAQPLAGGPEAPLIGYWMWRFDRPDDPIPLDNFWGKTPEGAVADLRRADNPFISRPAGPVEVELVVDSYFPATVSSLPDEVRGAALHRGGRNRLFLDGHAAFERDARLK
ncbi:MAG: DUF1559 domain-containing protein [Verrucomicrobia bacterium]|nr:MAG: DUF1559 domain-containing protein [Verrucomicrobiota bacterium]